MEFKGTKGKWKLHKHAFACVVSDESSLLVSNCCGRTSNLNSDELYIEQQANALLISKAPEMLEMLKLWCMDMEERGRAYGDCYEMTKQLIKEATEI